MIQIGSIGAHPPYSPHLGLAVRARARRRRRIRLGPRRLDHRNQPKHRVRALAAALPDVLLERCSLGRTQRRADQAVQLGAEIARFDEVSEERRRAVGRTARAEDGLLARALTDERAHLPRGQNA